MVKQEKIKAVEDLASLLNKYPVIGVLDLYKTPASALQKIKMNIKDRAMIKVAKKSIILRSMDKANKQGLKEFLKGYPALIFSNEDPFKLYMSINRQRIPASAKPGDIPDEDIEVKTGPTELMPGPAISTLTKVKIPAKVEAGKIAIMRDKVVCKAGEAVSVDLSSALQLLKLQPMEVGLNVVVLEENGKVYQSDVLFIDEKEVYNNIILAIQNSFNLSINSGYPTKETIGMMLAKAQMNAKQLEAELNLGKKEEPKEEPKKEEAPKEETKPEEQKEAPQEEVKEEEKNDDQEGENKKEV